MYFAEFRELSQYEGRADVWMPGKRHLLRRRENSHLPRVSSFGRKHKRGFRIVELTRDLLHLQIGKAFGVRQHGQWVPAKASVCKHITSNVTVVHLQLGSSDFILAGLWLKRPGN